MRIAVGIGSFVAVMVGIVGVAEAGTITAAGAVNALTNASQMIEVVGNGDFDEGPINTQLPAGVYAAKGLTWRSGTVSTFLPGVPNDGGYSVLGFYTSNGGFAAPIAGGGTHVGLNAKIAGVATFSVRVTQVGLTASTNGTQYLTAWSSAGAVIGQVTWTPANDSSFVGIDTMGVPIAMIAYGNHDVWAGQPYTPNGATTISDSWMWATGTCTADAQCDDGLACTADTCTVATGVCVHTANVCTAQDQCHGAGTCNAADGTCSNPAKVDGAACTDGDACTQTDTCQAGVCSGASPVVCTAKDGCHDVGVCNTNTGVCTDPTKADGVACTDGNLCTQTDTCAAGVCSGANPVVCPAPDQCHTQGACELATGTCTQVAKADGTACDDGNKCTIGDTCQAGACSAGAPVACNASTCHAGGSCNPADGKCSTPSVPDGTPCTGGTCSAGSCDAPDAGAPDAGAKDGGANDGGTTASDDAGRSVDAGRAGGAGDAGDLGDASGGGCGCTTAGNAASPLGWLVALAGVVVAARRRRRGR